MSAPRIGLIGARRVRQGLGPFVAQFLSELGAEIPAFLGTSASSVQAATEDLEKHGVEGAHKNRDGSPIWGPSGAGIWSSPTVDPEKNVVYVGTGDNHSPPATETRCNLRSATCCSL